jgi:hypothetical protein
MYGDDGAWQFDLEDPGYRQGVRYKLVLDHLLYMDGPDQTMTRASEARLDDASVPFLYAVAYVTDLYRDRRLTLGRSTDDYQADLVGTYADGAWRFSLDQADVLGARTPFRIELILDGIAADRQPGTGSHADSLRAPDQRPPASGMPPQHSIARRPLGEPWCSQLASRRRPTCRHTSSR